MSQPATAARLLKAQFNHLVLPTRLPGKRDDNLARIETAIADRLLDACRFLQESATIDDYHDWDHLRRVLLATKTVHSNGKIDKVALIQELQLRGLGPDGFLILHVTEQNAGLLIRRVYGDHGQEVVFEAFEASPRSEDVLAAEAALQWDFPGGAVAVPYSTFANDGFQDSLAGFLQQCSTESIKRFAAHVCKGGSFAIETRHTTDPAMITSLLMTMLEAHGRRLSTPLLRKRVRDNVCWEDGAEKPWRRLPFWLVLRVGLARYLAIKHGGEIGRLRYKFLVCVALAQLLQDSLNHLDLQSITTLKGKLARRLAKLEMAKSRASLEPRIHYDAAFASMSPTFEKALQQANLHIVQAWDFLKASIKRPIRPLPRHANEEHLTLTLRNSGTILHNILNNPSITDERPMGRSGYDRDAANPAMRSLANRCFSLTQAEMEVEQGSAIDESSTLSDRCIEVCGKIDKYIDLVSSAYDGNPEQKSVMILTIMHLWVILDQAATELYGLLLAFSPGISPDALDVLQLPRPSDMERLQYIQKWLRFRQEKSRRTQRTIFDNPSRGCFAARYFDESDDGTLKKLRDQIEQAAEIARAAKEEEFETLSRQYEELQQRIAEMSCVYVTDGFAKEHNFSKCTKCYLERAATRTYIATHEDFLPQDPVHAKAVVFELGCRASFAAYRNATWRILGALARSKFTHCCEPRVLIQKHIPLARFTTPFTDGVTLASKTKSFLDTHYRNVSFPASLDDPKHNPLSVELKRLELTFFVNAKQNLQCRELRAEIDPNQDAGTWYGLSSKLVLRDPLNLQNRSIIVPIGPVASRRNKSHVAVYVQPNGKYARYSINTVLGRLDCPAEPWLLYLKAQLHAFTSAILPDPLTGRTGTEEALHLLRSGSCQPWTPLQCGPLSCLVSIASLTPEREYYPEGWKEMQVVHWNTDLTTTIQRDEFLPLVESICRRSSELDDFVGSTAEKPQIREVDLHLLQRSIHHRRLYERPSDEAKDRLASSDVTYMARDRHSPTNQCQNVFDSVKLLMKWSPKLPTTMILGCLLQQWPDIQGHGQKFDKVLLSDILDLKFGIHWGSLVDFCRKATHNEVYSLTFMFGVLSFGYGVDMQIVRTLIAFAISEPLKSLEPPKWPFYSQFRQGHVPTVAYLTQLMRPCLAPYPGDHRSEYDALSAKSRRKLEQQQQAYEEKADEYCNAFANLLLKQWPCAEPTLDRLSQEPSPLLNVAQAFKIIKPEWLRLFQNLELSQYIAQVQQILNHHQASPILTQMEPDLREEQFFFFDHRGDAIPSLSRDLMCKSGRTTPKRKLDDLTSSPQMVDRRFGPPRSSRADKENISQNHKQPRQVQKFSRQSQEIADLEQIVQALSKSRSTVRKHYARDLTQSIDSLKSLSTEPPRPNDARLEVQLAVATSQARQGMQDQLDSVLSNLERGDARAKWLKAGGLWPCTTTVALLEQIRSTSATVSGSGMKESLVDFAISITHLQKALRLRDASLKNKQKLEEEQAHSGHTNWQPISNTDWLLLEIDSNILIRPGQIDVAIATISPSSGANSVLQMNMGRGKTSCVIPMVAASLADTKRLVRIIVPNALLSQTAQLLHGRLGGLLGRQIRHVPYSRRTQTAQDTTKAFWEIHKQMMRDAGIMVALPEHTMSFMLSGLQRLSDNRIPEATPMVKVQAWMRKVCRDVLDESDFTLAVRTQLIYPSGQQTSVDGHPHRWETAEALLKLVESHIWDLQRDFPCSIEVIIRSTRGFPLFFLLRKDVEDALITRVVDDVVSGKTPILPCQEFPLKDRQAIRRYLTDASVDQATLDRLQLMFTDTPIARQSLHHMRGLLVHRILLLTFKKRWSVQYGLHPTRDPIAVPYHAKGVPSEQAEWGHPDVAILFTCLSFYYQGLSLTQIRQCLENVVKSDDPSSEYDRWMHSGPDMPGSLRDWNVINVDDESQLHELWQHLQHSIIVANYYLNHFVFPVHAKQFKIKLQSSGWDIPLMAVTTSPDRKPPSHKPLTTGFSGTNDNRTLLPLTIRQHDLAGLSHTNAEVITYLLQQRNRRYFLAADQRGRRLPETEFLRKLLTLRIRVLIDAGAQILEMDNLTLAKSWLRIDKDAKAALFFSGNRPYILYRNGSPIPLLASPFAEDLSGCLVYLDEAHTRGTDLKMPVNAKGALTLGLGQTKDHTVQAAMRMRQLATTQSVVFFATPEVHQSIRDHRSTDRRGAIDSYDVVCWLLEQTCAGLEQLQPLYYAQGVDFCRRSQACIDNPDILTDADQRENCLKELRHVEHQTLEQMYKPKTKTKVSNPSSAFSPQLAGLMKELNTLRKGFQDDGNAVHASALQEVEQEREVAHEVENIREVQEPVYFSPIKFPGLHHDIKSFALTGRLVAGSFGYEHMFICLRGTALGSKHRINPEIITSNLFVSKQFTKTVVLNQPDDNFLRQVNWVLWSTAADAAIVVVPEEAELLIPLLRNNATKTPVTAHLLTYAPAVTRKMVHFSDLTYYAIPPLPRGWKAPDWLRVELGLFAGRLYFEYDEYAGIMRYLGIIVDDQSEDGTHDDRLLSDGEMSDSVVVKKKASTTITTPFTNRPLTFVREWLASRRKGQDFSHTPMGFVCQGRPLAADHPFFAAVVGEPTLLEVLGRVRDDGGNDGGGVAVGAAAAKAGDEDDDDEDEFDGADEDLWFDAEEAGGIEGREGEGMDVDEDVGSSGEGESSDEDDDEDDMEEDMV
ncbi:hypothetical protein BK809_0007836 [Diplodia seriata]|uniref:ubiquitinyl hydrolase 1 n=1 Tax=Diplodia seriata TaxID=420778 RepID=A0A1S8BJR8_9PEZI|nr:hypothetical protein BK809_0007836 [Diplodia seriata]